MQRLIERLHENDEVAFEEIYYLIHQKIYCFILRYVKDSPAAQELTQHFFVRLWEKRQQLSTSKPLEAQAFVMARNLVIDELRRMARYQILIDRFMTWKAQKYEPAEAPIFYADLREQFDAAVDALPQKRREIFILSRDQGLTYREIANRLAISPKTVEVQMNKALKVVRAKLSAYLQLFL